MDVVFARWHTVRLARRKSSSFAAGSRATLPDAIAERLIATGIAKRCSTADEIAAEMHGVGPVIAQALVDAGATSAADVYRMAADQDGAKAIEAIDGVSQRMVEEWADGNP